MVKELPLQRISELLEYDKDSGNFYWKCHRGNGVKKGDKAGCKMKSGYIQIYIDNIPYLAHRIALSIILGRSISVVDHIDGNPSNNKSDNLRESSAVENAQNTKGRGYCKTPWGYSAKITVNYKQKHLGYFNTAEEASEAYLKAKRKFHKSFETGQGA